MKYKPILDGMGLMKYNLYTLVLDIPIQPKSS